MAFIKSSPRRAAKRRADLRQYRKVCQQVDERDGDICRVCHQPIWTQRHHHHIVYRSRGGKHESGNLIVVCATCHEDIHHHRVTVTGDANATLTIRRHR